MRNSKPTRHVRRSGNPTVAFRALIEFVRKKREVGKGQAGKLLGMHPPGVNYYEEHPIPLRSTWIKRYEKLWCMGVKQGWCEATSELLGAARAVHGVATQKQLAGLFGVRPPAVSFWQNGRNSPTKRHLRRLLLHGALLSIHQVVEFHRVTPHKRRVTWCLSAHKEERAKLKKLLGGKKGLYVLYSSMGSAIYVGQTQKDLLVEVEQRLAQKMRGQIYGTGMKKRECCVGDAARYLSAYEVKGEHVLNKLEALLIRTMANDLQNRHIERL